MKNPGVIVDYDSGTDIELTIGFEVRLGALFHAFIDGCDGAMFSGDSDSKDK